MHTVVNHLPIRPDADRSEMAARFEAFAADPRGSHPKVRGAQLLKAGDTEAILVIAFEDQATMQHVSTVAAPWFAENIVLTSAARSRAASAR
jgi:hypothetical protein